MGFKLRFAQLDAKKFQKKGLDDWLNTPFPAWIS